MSDPKNHTYSSSVSVSPTLRLEVAEPHGRGEGRPQRQCLTSRPPAADPNREDLLNRLIEAIKAL